MKTNNGPIQPFKFYDKGAFTDEGYINPIQFKEPAKSPEEKIYLVLYYIVEDDGNLTKSFELCEGRSECVSFLVSIIDQIDIHQSKILTETRQTETRTGNIKNYFLYIDSALSVYDFFKYIESITDKEMDIDIEDYNYATPEDATDARPYRELPNTEAMQIWKAVMNESPVDKKEEPNPSDTEEDRYV